MKKLTTGAVLLAAVAVSFAVAGGEVQEVRITSEPAGAMLFIDGVYEGITPLDVNFPHGEHRLRLMRRGFIDKHAVISVPLDEPAVSLKLDAEAKGSITINSKPSEALVFLNGHEAGVTPLEISNLADDLYQLRVQKANHQTYQTQVEIKDGADVELDVTLLSNMRIYYENLLKNDPENIDLYTQFGHFLLVEGDFDYARSIFINGITLLEEGRPLDATNRLLIELVKVYAGQFNFVSRGKMPEFRRSFAGVIELAIERSPVRNPVYQQLTSIYVRLTDTETVAAFVERLQENEPSHNHFREFGLIYANRSDTKVAIRLLEKAVEIEEEPDFDLRFALGNTYHSNDQLDEALEQFKLCHDMNAGSEQRANLLEELIRVQMKKRDYSEAWKCFEEAKTHKETAGNRRWRMLEFNLLLESGRCQEAKAIAEKLLESDEQQDVREGQTMMRQVRARCGEEEN